MEVEMKIRGLMMDPVTNMPIVILKDVNGNTVLPIWVGIYEANAIALEIEKVSTPRPMTHDLIKSLLLGLRTGIRKVVVNELKEDTFYAVIWLERDGELICVDSRPSDALALALRLDCPIFVEDAVLKNSKLAATVRQDQQRRTAPLARGPERRRPRPLQDVGRFLDPKLLAQLERIAAARIQLLSLPQVNSHFAFERDGFVILVEKREDGFGGVGAPGLLSECGFAPLLNGEFVAKGFRRAASEEEQTTMRAFLADLQAALA